MNPSNASAPIGVSAAHRWLHDPTTPPPGEHRVGGKAQRLLELARAGFPVPAPLAIEADAYREHVASMPFDEPDPARWIAERALDPELETAIASRLPAEGGWGYAVRSSAICEDGAEHSFAGQLTTRLGVGVTEIGEAVRAVWASAHSDAAKAYAARSGLGGQGIVPAVVIQPLLSPDHAGVAFGFDPVDGCRRVVAVSSVRGLGEGLVSGLLDADEFRLRDGAIEIVRAPREVRSVRPDPAGGTRIVDDGPGDAVPARSLREIEAMVRSLESLLGVHQDVEWCVCGDRLHLLQARPATTLASLPDLSDASRIWESANIVESYPGVSSPLTLSFVREVYGRVYREFCRVLGVEEEVIAANDPVFEMLGSLRGRIHYDLANWYKVLSMLPGYDLNARFMEQMMGVKDRFDPDVDLVRSRRHPWLRLAGLVSGLVGRWFGLPKSVRDFHARVDEVLARVGAVDHDRLRAQELVDLFRGLERDLLAHWRAPLVNDFFAMIVHGALRRMLARRCPDGEALANALLRGEGGIVSTEPLDSLERIAAACRRNPSLLAVATAPPEEFLRAVRRDPEVGPLFESHLARFGDRCPGELKLESVPPSLDPSLTARDVQAWIRSASRSTADRAERDAAARERAQARLDEVFAGRPWRGIPAKWLVGKARTLVRDRENLRFERTRAYGAVRRIFLALGRRLAAEGRIGSQRDIFWLTRGEIFDFVEGRGFTTDLRALVALRREEYARYAEAPLPAERLVTRGMAGQCLFEPDRAPSGSSVDEPADGDVLRGLGCGSGVVRARVRIVRDPASAPDLEGRILVAERTDPGWAPLFPLARGLLVERGSLLSHSAIVAREMGIPAVVGLAGLLGRLADGEMVEMDGSTGIVRKIPSGGGA